MYKMDKFMNIKYLMYQHSPLVQPIYGIDNISETITSTKCTLNWLSEQSDKDTITV